MKKKKEWKIKTKPVAKIDPKYVRMAVNKKNYFLDVDGYGEIYLIKRIGNVGYKSSYKRIYDFSQDGTVSERRWCKC